MSQDKKATLLSSEDAANQNFATDNQISGGCAKCGCEVLIYYHYDSGKPVPNAPFVLVDSNKTEIHGKTDAKGLCKIYDMGCGTFELMLDEGSDDFKPRETVENNPVLQANPAYATLAGEYFTLFLLLRKQGLVTYDVDDSSDRHVDVDGAGLFTSIPKEYRKSYDRFWELDKRVNRGSRQLKQAINKIHHSLAAEVADKGGDDNAALMLFCEIALGFIPVVGQAMDVYSIGEWSWQSYKEPAKLEDPLHIAEGALCAIGVIPGLGDALKVSGRAIIRALKVGTPKELQFAIRTIRSLSDGNLVKGLTKLRAELRNYGAQAKALLLKIHAALKQVLAESALKNNWIVSLMKDSFSAMITALEKLIAKYDSALAYIESKFNEFIGKVVTRVSGSARPKGSIAKAAEAPKAPAHAESQAAKPEATTTKSGEGKKAETKADGIKEGRPVTKKSDNAITKADDGKPKNAVSEKKRRAPSKETEDISAGSNKGEQPDSTPQQKKAGEDDKACKAGSEKCQSEGEPVDMATGYVVDWRTDFTLTSLLPLSMKRYYRSGGERKPGLLGALWRTNWDMGLELENGIATLTDGEFNQAVFVLPDEGAFSRAASNPAWRLTRQQGQLVLQNVDGVRYRFEHALGLQLCLSAIEDQAGNRIALLWDRADLCWIALPDGRLVHVETQRRRIVKLTLCDEHRQTLKTLASYRYDAQGHLLSVRAGEGRNFDYRYSPEGWLLRWSDLAHTWVEHDYDEQGRALRDRTAEGFWPGSFSYDPDSLTNHYHSGFGGVTTYVRDARNNILLRREPDGGEVHFEWDNNNQLAAQTDPLGQRTEYQRNDWGQVTAVTLPDGSLHRYDYDDDGQLLAYTDPLGNAWQYTRNAQGLVETASDPEGRSWRHAYTAQGLLSAVTGPDGREQHYHYNRRGLLERLEPGEAPAVTFFYDAQDRLTERHIAHEQGVQVRRWDYEGGRDTPSKVVYEDGSETRFGYDTEGNLTSVTDALGQRYLFRYGAFDNLLEATDPLGATVRYHYNAESEFAGVTNSQGQAWHYQFDASGRLSEERHYDGRVYRYGYDVAGRLTRRTAPDGSHLEYGYDAGDRLSEIQAVRADGASEGATTFAYDLSGRLLKAASPDAVVEYDYNRAGQVVSERVNGEEVRSGYDDSGQRSVVEGLLSSLSLGWQGGRLTTLSIGSHQPLTFSHTASGYEQLRSNGEGFALRHEWSATGLLAVQALDGVNGVLERRYQYDVLDRLTGIRDSHWGEQALRLNGAGQVTAERREQGRQKQARLFGYDSEQNLCEVSAIAPDGAGRLSAKNATVQSSAGYDAAGRVTQRGGHQYQYDACGRLAVRRESRPGFRAQETRFEWDAQDRLVRVSLPDGARWRYRYDAFGRRVSKVREGQVPSAQAVARVAYRWDGDQLSGQTQYRVDGSVARAVQWVYEPGSFRPLAQVEEQAGETRLHYIVTDLTGTARELCSETGDVHWRGEQGLWGAYREDKRPIPLRRYLGDAANEEVYCELRYQGQVYDAETGLYYNRHRYFDPESGQYLSSDPIGLAGGLRPQGYVHNPMELVDPLGLVGDPANATHITYQGVKNGKPYVGYASKPGLGHSAQDVLNYRYGNNFDVFDVKPEPFYRGDGLEGKYTARGLEQRTFEDLGGLEGTSNKQNPIGPNNPRRDDYLAAADNHRTKGDKCP
ncbi:RHS repeat-associated core domain-containing protein [Dickeya fangzhongdai]|uniref:RHS repeat-associated core domain-containing protein n=3 Tax=Dickeya fangzhongdai TaxID=1778540 RepID=UPI001CE36D3C|nr:RHS repeat-associated core domain-containing protein [Dickeya fangzhongdai]WOY01253.1 RHS repeat-associated core domain-containing protein [Dickeya fangzhongdai]WOY03556.1 RHS repeat-associated core domain-containing protein [Dickeya fangzhongdai]